ncbi:MAG: TetR/AcrR family transcriptional regulator [Pseudomonadales bacterium]
MLDPWHDSPPAELLCTISYINIHVNHFVRIGTLKMKKSVKRARGRPRQYDEDSALQAAGEVFWVKGFSAASLDDLSAAMGMNRPSIYRAFGDKEAIYRKALLQFRRGMEAAFARTMLAESDIRKALARFYREALATYTSGQQPRGCMVMSTAVAAATCHPEIQADLLTVIRDLDHKIALRLEQARDAGQLEPSFDVIGRAAIAQSVLHSLSLRARAGETPSQLRKMIKNGVETILS